MHRVFPWSTRASSAFRPVLAGLLYFVAAALSLRLAIGQAGIATFWPASGILFAILFATTPRRRPLYLATAAIGSIVANLEAGTPVWSTLGYTVANIVEPSLGVWLLSLRRACRVTFTAPEGLSCFCKAATMCTAVSAAVSTVLTQGWSSSFWLSWFVTDLLGILIVAPLILMVIERAGRTRGIRSGIATVEIWGILAFVAAVAIAVFAQSSYPLLFVPMLAVLFATFRLGPVGAAGSVLIVSLVSAVAMSAHVGPPTLIRSGILTQSLFVQAYLLSLFAASLPIAALLSARRRLLAQLGTEKRLLEMAEAAAKVGHWHFDREGERLTWSAEVYRIHGIDPSTPLSLERALAFYHPDDRERVVALVSDAIEREQPYVFDARIVRPDGEVRHLLARGEIDRRIGESLPGVFGIVQDVTELKAQETALREAARTATLLADTDVLTGIANRRRSLTVLAEALDAATDTGKPVSFAILDIDHFKRINDGYGHPAGDAVLKRVAAQIGAELRAADLFGRFGGEELVIVLPDTAADQALAIAERVRRAVETARVEPAVTLSIGVAEHVAGEGIDALIGRADAALYRAKQEGRNALRLAA